MDTRKNGCGPWAQGHDHLVMENDTGTQIKLPKRDNSRRSKIIWGNQTKLQELGGEFGMDVEQ